ncbi:MAG: HRDC domain-containing protein [Kiritimatiellae bacterium]|nr:HRDC domain-containing protein [Kiritimatiellia bacterium]
MESIRYEFIDRDDALRKALACLQGRHCLALDLEMENQRHHYGLHVALIQISTSEHHNFIFDPLAGLNLAPLNAIFSNPQIELIVHDADFDRRTCRQVYGLNLINVFDTKIAAQLCGFRKFGLANLLQDLLNTQTDKKFQKIDWLKRPLPKEALDYAARDTASLHTLKDILTRKLVELGRLDWAREEFRRAELIEPAPDLMPPHHRIKQSALLTPRQLAILGSLTRLRDEIARSVNRPVHFIIRNDLLLRMATKPPATIDELRQVKSLHPAMYRERTAQRLLEAVRQGQLAPEESHPHLIKRPRSKSGYEQRLKAMQAWRALTAAPYGLEPYLMLSNDILQWAARHPDQPMPPDVAAQIRTWQKKIVWERFERQFLAPASKPSVPCANELGLRV